MLMRRRTKFKDKAQSSKLKDRRPKTEGRRPKAKGHLLRFTIYHLPFTISAVSEKISLMIVAGEPSGDAHAASLVRALRETSANVEFGLFGAIGPLMRRCSVDTVIASYDLAILGLAKIFERVSRLEACCAGKKTRRRDFGRLARFQSASRKDSSPSRIESDLLHKSTTLGLAIIPR